MLQGGWCSGLGLGEWLLVALLWASFLALAIWTVSRMFPAGGRDDADRDDLVGTRRH